LLVLQLRLCAEPERPQSGEVKLIQGLGTFCFLVQLRLANQKEKLLMHGLITSTAWAVLCN
jgi:hypothetical protein